MKIATLPIDNAEWREFTETHPQAGVFHTPTWTSVVADSYGFDAFVLAALETDGEVLAGLPVVSVRSPLGRTRWVSLPFSDSCPLLVREGVAEDDVVEALRTQVLESTARELEVRGALPEQPDVHEVEVGYLHTVPLTADPADLHPKKNHRNARNRAQRNGVRVTRGTSADDVEAYYRLHTLTRRRHGVPVQPRRFFDLIAERLVVPGHGFVASASLEGDIVAAGLYLGHNGTLVAKFGASDPDRQDTGAGYLIDWEIMQAACVEGYHTLDLGRTDSDAEGLRLYKNGWGAVEEPLVYAHVSRTAPSTARVGVGSFSQSVIRRSPVWVCRALGEVLYRWSA